MTYNEQGKRTSLENLAGQITATAWDGWSVTYNGENRPVFWSCVQSNNSNNTNNQTILSMSYDHMGRRVTKDAQCFEYDGYLQVADNCDNGYIWDPTEQVATRPLVFNCGASPAYNTHDADKNVSEIVVMNCGVVAHYEYTPFGAVAERSGGLSIRNPWRFSSEYTDDISATIYYNYRSYEPNLGRWLSRDPIEEDAGCALYAFEQNDYLGLFSITIGGDGNDKGTQYRGVISGTGYAFDWGLSWSATIDYSRVDDCTYELSGAFTLGAEAGLTAGFAGMHSIGGYNVWLLAGLRGFVGVEASTKFAATISACSSCWGASVSASGYLGSEGGFMARYSKKGGNKWKEIGVGARARAVFGTSASLKCCGDKCTLDGHLGLQPFESEIFLRLYFVSMSWDLSDYLNDRIDTSRYRKDYHFEFDNPLGKLF